MTLQFENSGLPKARSRLPARAMRGLRAVLLLLLLGTAIWFGRVPLLQGAAEAWIVSDPIESADAVAIFGGGLDVRPFAAAKYYHEGIVRKILVSNIRSGAAEKIGVVQSHVDLNRRVLLTLGVPETAIEVFGSANTNTRDEAAALVEWARLNNAHRLIVPTEIFSSRRVRWILRRVFAGTDTQVDVPALNSSDYDRTDWWNREAGLLAFQNEVFKYFYYRFKY